MTTSKRIPAETLFAEWQSDPAYQEAFDELEAEFTISEMIIKARLHAGLTQAELAKKMKTSQSTITRLESGKANPSQSTLMRLAQATGHKLSINLIPDGA